MATTATAVTMSSRALSWWITSAGGGDQAVGVGQRLGYRHTAQHLGDDLRSSPRTQASERSTRRWANVGSATALDIVGRHEVTVAQGRPGTGHAHERQAARGLAPSSREGWSRVASMIATT